MPNEMLSTENRLINPVEETKEELQTHDTGQKKAKNHIRHNSSESASVSSAVSLSSGGSDSSGSSNSGSESSGSNSYSGSESSGSQSSSGFSSGSADSSDSSNSDDGDNDMMHNHKDVSSGSESLSSTFSGSLSSSASSIASLDSSNSNTNQDIRGKEMLKKHKRTKVKLEPNAFSDLKDYIAEVNNQTPDIATAKDTGGKMKDQMKQEMMNNNDSSDNQMMMMGMMGNCHKKLMLIDSLRGHIKNKELIGEKSPSLQDAKELLLILQLQYASKCNDMGMMMKMNMGMDMGMMMGMGGGMDMGGMDMGGMDMKMDMGGMDMKMDMGGGMDMGGMGGGMGGMDMGGMDMKMKMQMMKMMEMQMMKMNMMKMSSKMKMNMNMMKMPKPKPGPKSGPKSGMGGPGPGPGPKSGPKSGGPGPGMMMATPKPTPGMMMGSSSLPSFFPFSSQLSTHQSSAPQSSATQSSAPQSSATTQSSFVPFSSANGSLRARLRKRTLRNQQQNVVAKEEVRETKSLSWWWPSPPEIINKMFEIANLKAGETVYDLGCGDGRIPVQAAKKWGCTGVGVDFDENLVRNAKKRVVRMGVENKVEIRHGDALKVEDIHKADVVTLYILDRGMKLIKPILQEKLKKGTRIVSHNYKFKDWTPKQELTATDNEGHKHWIYLYEV